MRKSLFLLLAALLGTGTLYAAKHKKVRKSYQDRDLDGVIDRYDRCPHTPFFAIVNKNGCMIKRLKVSRDQERAIKKLISQSR